MENKIIYRGDWATFNREKFIKPIIITTILLLFLVTALFNPTFQPFAIFGLMVSIPTSLILLVLYSNRPSRENDRKEYVYVQFKNNSLKISLRKESELRGHIRAYLIEEINFPKITYQIFEIPYSEITYIKESGGSGVQNPYYGIYCSSDTVITKSGIFIPSNTFEEELKHWLTKLGNTYNIKTFS